MLNKAQKKELVEKLSAELAGLKGAVLSSFQGLPAAQMQKLRGQLRGEGVQSKVVKLTLLRRVLEKIGVDVSSFNYTVPLTLSWSADDEVLPAKILNTFAKKQENLKMVAGVLAGKLIDGTQVKALAMLPGKQELQGQLVGVIAGPLRGLVSVLSGNMRQLVYALNAIGKSKN